MKIKDLIAALEALDGDDEIVQVYDGMVRDLVLTPSELAAPGTFFPLDVKWAFWAG